MAVRYPESFPEKMGRCRPLLAWWEKMGRARLVERPFWQVTTFFWMVFAAAALGLRLFLHEPFAPAVFFTLLMEGTAIALSFGMRAIYQRTREEFGVSTALLLIVVSFVAAAGQTALATAVTVFTGLHNALIDFFVTLTLRLLVMWAVFMIWSLGYFWWRAEIQRHRQEHLRRAAQREAQRWELQLLRAQLDPHFLFNSLNGIAAEIEPHPERATAMVEELAAYLRYSLAHRKKAIGLLSAELEAMAAYLEIEKARFGERLRAVVRASESARRCRVPSFLLQPLVENAVKHGLENALETVDLDICAEVEGEDLTITVSNSGTLAASQKDHAASAECEPEVGGVGLENLRRRLALHYPGRAKFRLHEKDGRVWATLHLHGSPCSA